MTSDSANKFEPAGAEATPASRHEGHSHEGHSHDGHSHTDHSHDGQGHESQSRDGHSHDHDLPPLSMDSGLCGGPGQMSCEEANEMIQMVLDHLVDSEKQAKLVEHFGDCSPCESEFVVYERIVASLTRARPALPVDAEQRLKHYCSGLASTPSDDGSDSSDGSDHHDGPASRR